MKRIVYNQLAITVFILFFLIPGKSCLGIPAFARKYQISCQVCHSPAIPRLKEFGDEFAVNGFRMTKYQSPRYFIPTGDDQLSLFRELPLAIRMDGFASYNFNNGGSADFGSPFVLKILSGGELSEKLSYYFYFLFDERGSVAGVEDAFIMYHDLFKSGINFYMGQFQVSDPLFKGELRFTLEPYKIYDARPGNSSANLKYDRGIILEKDFKSGTSVIGEILNGCGIGEAGEGYLFDKDKYKNLMVRVSQTLGKSASIGLFVYNGKEDLSDPAMLTANRRNSIRMFGADLSIDLAEKLILNVQFVKRTDSELFVGSDGTVGSDVNTDGGFVEIIYSPKGDKSKWYLTGLLNWVESGYNQLDYRSATLHAGYVLRRNLRLVTEYTRKFSGVSYGKVSVGFVSAF